LFRIWIDSMSAGLMSEARLGATVLASAPAAVPDPVAMLCVEKGWLSIGCPSTTNNGWFVPESEAAPRILIDADAPGSPDRVRTSTFGAWAASAETTFCGLAERFTALLSMLLIVVVSLSRVVDVPAPVTTTTSRLRGFTTSEKSWVRFAPDVSVRDTGRARPDVKVFCIDLPFMFVRQLRARV